MNNYKLLALCLLLAGCSSASRDFKAEQQAYEAKKKIKEAENGGFFKSNEAKIKKKLTTITSILQAAHTSTYSNPDSLYFYDKEPIVFAENYLSRGYTYQSGTKEEEPANALVLTTSADGQLKEMGGLYFPSMSLIKRLTECYRDSFFIDCYKIQNAKLEEFLAIKYIFAVREIIYAKPEVKTGNGGKEFNSGIYMASVYIFDISELAEKARPFYNFSFVGQNSDVVQVTTNQYYDDESRKLVSNFHSNCYDAFNEKCAKHFTVKKPLEKGFSAF